MPEFPAPISTDLFVASEQILSNPPLRDCSHYAPHIITAYHIDISAIR